MEEKIKQTIGEEIKERLEEVPIIEIQIGTTLYYKNMLHVEKTKVSKIVDGYIFAEGFDKRIEKANLKSVEAQFYPYSFQANGAHPDCKFFCYKKRK